MPRYYFDVRRGGDFTPDYEGLELADFETAREEATHALADMARDSIRGTTGIMQEEMAIEVRDQAGSLMQARFTFIVDRQ